MEIPVVKKPAVSLAKAILEVNETSFRWYILGLFGILMVNRLTGGWLQGVGLPISPLYTFVGVSVILKFFYHIDEIIEWLQATQKDFKSGKLFIGILVKLIIKADVAVGFLKERILGGQTIVQRLPVLFQTVFSWLLILYLGLLVLEELKSGWVLVNLHLKLNTLFVWLICTGIASVLLNVERKETIDRVEKNIFRRQTSWKEWAIVAMLTVGSGLIVYWKLSAIGWLAFAIAGLSTLVVLLMSVLIIADQDYAQKS